MAAVTRVLSRYVLAINNIYQITDFLDNDGRAEGITFAVQTVQVYLTADQISRNLNSEFANQLIGVDRFLDVWSQVC